MNTHKLTFGIATPRILRDDLLRLPGCRLRRGLFLDAHAALTRVLACHLLHYPLTTSPRKTE